MFRAALRDLSILADIFILHNTDYTNYGQLEFHTSQNIFKVLPAVINVADSVHFPFSNSGPFEEHSAQIGIAQMSESPVDVTQSG